MNQVLRLLCCFGLAALGQVAAGDERITLENSVLAVEVSKRNGAIVSLRDKATQLELISRPAEKVQPWLLLLDKIQFVRDWGAFSSKRRDGPKGQRLTLRWMVKDGIAVQADLFLPTNSDRLIIKSRAENTGNRTIIALNYPRLQGIGPLSQDGSKDLLLHSALGGVLVRNPFQLFDANAQIQQGRGFLPSRYPNAFSGSPLQMMDYYTEGCGGFYIRVEDAQLTDKDLNFFKTSGNRALMCEIAHFQWDARPGADLELTYPVVIAAMMEGTWYEAAEHYRNWAVRQPWCARGTRRERVERGDASRWLFEEIGAVGMWWPFDTDIRKAVRLTRETFGAPILQFSLKWTHTPSVAAARRGGGRFGPFCFPFVALEGSRTYTEHAEDSLVPRKSPVVPKWIAMCPAQPGWRETVIESDKDLAGSGPLRHHPVWIDENRVGCEADAIYWDVGPCAGVPTHCYDRNHQHRPGAGREITQAYITLIKNTQDAVSKVKGAYVPVGTECVSEPFVSSLDMYYARTAGFDPWMEAMPYIRFLTWLPDQKMEIVPLWEFVYHEYSPVAMQGIYGAYHWPVREGDDYWVWAEARATLWGQLVVTPPLLPSVELPNERIRFLQSITAAHTGFARDLLAYGRMQRPPRIACGSITIRHGLAEGGWLRKLIFSPQPTNKEDGRTSNKVPSDGDWSVQDWIAAMRKIPSNPARHAAITVPSVMAQAYTFDKHLGILLVNLHKGQSTQVVVPISPAQCGLPHDHYNIYVVRADTREAVGTVTDTVDLSMDLPPREFVLVEVRPKKAGSKHDE